jgi:hypothetical protein
VRFCLPGERLLRLADVVLGEIAEEPEYLQKPKDHCNYYNAIENSFDLALHGDKAVDEPHNNANNDKGENQSHKGHFALLQSGNRS